MAGRGVVLHIASRLFLGLLVPFCLYAKTASGVITSYETGTHVAIPGNSLFGVNLDGVALIAGDVPDSSRIDQLIPVCSGALITDTHLISAAHCFDEDNDANPDPFFTGFPHVAAFELADRTEIIRITTERTKVPLEYRDLPADIAILTLERPAPDDIPRYALLGFPEAFGTVVVAGYGGTGNGADGAVPGFDPHPIKRAGLNSYEALRDGPPFPGLDLLVYDFDSGQESHNALRQIGIRSDLGFGTDEVYAARGDSGGPVFFAGSIAAITAFGGRMDEAPEGSWGQVSFDVPVATFRDFIEETTGGQAVFVPEPSTFGVALAFFFVFVTYLRRDRSGASGIEFNRL